MQILVLEDSDMMRNIIVKNMLAVGLQENEITEAGSGAEAVEKLKSKAFDILVLDIVMDGINGIEVLKQAKNSQPQARVIMCSTFSEKQTVKELIELGIDDFIVKPFTEERLKEAILRNIERCSAFPED